MTKWERRQQFETFMRLRELAEPDRIIAADGWTPDISVLDKTVARSVTTGRIETVKLPNGLYEARRVQEETDSWYAGRGAATMDDFRG